MCLAIYSLRPVMSYHWRPCKVGDLLIDVNGQAIPNDRPESELRRLFATFKRPVTLGFYKVWRADTRQDPSSI